MNSPLALPSTKRFAMRGARSALSACLALAAVLAAAAPAPAQGLLDSLLGILVRPPPPATPVPAPDTASPPGTPRLSITVTPRWSAGRNVAGYCVRLCDGRYFPLPRLASRHETPVQLCNALCPASRTMVYWGSTIDSAVAANGSRYSALETAFDFRKSFVAGCTCNGKDPVGTAAVSLSADVSLRPGDIVATRDGFQVFLGAKPASGDLNFTPVEDFPRLSADIRAELATRRVADAPAPNPPKELDIRTRIIIYPLPLDRRFFWAD